MGCEEKGGGENDATGFSPSNQKEGLCASSDEGDGAGAGLMAVGPSGSGCVPSEMLAGHPCVRTAVADASGVQRRGPGQDGGVEGQGG